jgi:NAD(P)-dependent dehydrogenase (short-subunit alcohol dehydrogenase family)
MDIAGRNVLILGGSGLVGTAVARRLLVRRPKRIVLVALTEEEARSAGETLRADATDVAVEWDWGNIFLPKDAAKVDPSVMKDDDDLRHVVVTDLLSDYTEDVLRRSFLFHLFQEFEPHAVVDCVNTATAFAYQDVFHSARALLDLAAHGEVTPGAVERHLLTLTMPQLIRHVQIAVESMRQMGTEAYVKIGTSGTGGMGLNIPYTHSEERPSRTLLAKAAVAGAHSMLLFLVARTPGAPATHEIKPTAAIGWREIAFGPIRRRGRPIARVDCPKPIPVKSAFQSDVSGWTEPIGAIESVYIDVGENGVFARDEFETVTALGQMEFITAEEVAEHVVMELEGRPTGKDIVAALDSSTAGPTYAAGLLRTAAVKRLEALEREHGIRSVAFEMLGPPRLTKMLYEADICGRLRSSLRELAQSDPTELAREAVDLVAKSPKLRSFIVSIGIPILIADDEVYRAANVLI